MIALVLLAQVSFPENPRFDYSGTPQFPDASASAITLRTHSVTLDLDRKTTKVSTVTQIKNNLRKPVTLTIVFPRRRVAPANAGPASFDIVATWNGTNLGLVPARDGAGSTAAGDQTEFRSDLTATVTLKSLATAGLRTSYTVASGKAGYGQSNQAAAYLLDPNLPIGQAAIAYRLAVGKVPLNLLQPKPDLGWQSGAKGASARMQNVQPGDRLTYVSFDPDRVWGIGTK